MTNEELKAVKMAWARGEVIQYMEGGRWKDWTSKSHLNTFNATEWRIKPDTISINGYDVLPPLMSFDSIDRYYVVSFGDPGLVSRFPYVNDDLDNILLSRGLCHATREAAELHAKALLSFTSKEEK